MAEIVESRKSLETVTPMMRQYLDVKEEYHDHILLYRLGDFYEMFFEDAVLASRVLDLTLTARDCGDGKRAAMCGVPFHKLDLYLARLVDKGYKAAICEQIENPAEAQGLVKREVVRVVTPGTVVDGGMLDDKKNNFLAAIYYENDGIGVGFSDVSTGQLLVTYLKGDDLIARLKNELAAYKPRETLLNVNASACPAIAEYLTDVLDSLLTDGCHHLFAPEGIAVVQSALGDEECKKFTHDGERLAAAALLLYTRETQKCEEFYVRELQVYREEQFMEIDQATRRNLELAENMRQKQKRGTLLWVLDRTETAMGARMLSSWIQRPLISPAAIFARQGAVVAMTKDLAARSELAKALSRIMDLERLASKAVYGTANARELRAIALGLSAVPAVLSCLVAFDAPRLRELYETVDRLEDLSSLLLSAITEDPPISVREGGMIRTGYNKDVDYLRSIAEDSQGWIERIEAAEREATGIKTLKVTNNKVFGYYIEVTKSLVDQVPARYVRKQTLTNCERYITQELKELEANVFSANDKLSTIEYDLICELRQTIAASAARIQETAAAIAEIDCYRSLAEVAVKNRYVCPEIDFSHEIRIKDGRHPVVERFVKDSYFVPNDTCLDCKDNNLMLITGPNMAGKSTYMRQVALITLMAQIGSFVPASEAHIGIVDKLFTRVGASDDLAAGQSTFMLEMTEVAYILKNATDRSLIIYDEVGRGTSTYDGMSIARAVAEYSVGKKLGAKTMFATHYHEMTDMEEQISGVVNYHIAAKKRGDDIIFLRKIVRGATDDSYGIEVAKLAGIPNEIVRRAKEILRDIEDKPESRPAKQTEAASEPFDDADLFSTLRSSENDEAAAKIRALDLNTLTPIEAMTFLYTLKQSLDRGQI